MQESDTERALRAAGSEYLPRDFIQTADGLLFAVVEAGVEAGRVLGFLRYQHTGETWTKFNTVAAQALLASHHPALLYHSPQHDADVHGVPVDQITAHYRPTHRLAQILGDYAAHNTRWPNSPDTNAWAKRLTHLAQVIGGERSAPAWLGVTGSLLVGAQRDGSDIDLVCYGRQHFATARQRMAQAQASGKLEPLPPELWRDAYQRRGCSLSWEEYLWHELRKNNKFAWDGVKVDVSLVDAPPPRVRRSGTKCQRAVVQCRVCDDTYAFDYPACYDVECAEICRIVCYTPTYFGQARTGEWIEAAGWLEQDSAGERRLLVGTSREADGQYIRVLPHVSSPAA